MVAGGNRREVPPLRGPAVTLRDCQKKLARSGRNDKLRVGSAAREWRAGFDALVFARVALKSIAHLCGCAQDDKPVRFRSTWRFGGAAEAMPC